MWGLFARDSPTSLLAPIYLPPILLLVAVLIPFVSYREIRHSRRPRLLKTRLGVWLPIGLTLVAFALRFYHFRERLVWLDEDTQAITQVNINRVPSKGRSGAAASADLHF